MSKEKINYLAELVKSLKRENDLLTKDNERLKNEVEELKTALTENIMKTTPTTCKEETEGPINFLPNYITWEKYHFKNGKDYELALANSDGVLIFKDSISSDKFDEKGNWDKSINNWEKCSLKRSLEKWWEENAPDVLKNNYKITIPVNGKLWVYNYEVCPACIPISNKTKLKNSVCNLECNETSGRVVALHKIRY